MLASIPFVILALISKSEPVIYASIFAAETLMFVNTGPCMAIIANVVQPNLRAAAFAISYFAVHFLGDIWSPWLIGKAADMFGDPETMNSSIGRALKAIGAVPTQVAGQQPREHRRRPPDRDPGPAPLGDRLPGRGPPPPPRDGPDAGQAQGRAGRMPARSALRLH